MALRLSTVPKCCRKIPFNVRTFVRKKLLVFTHLSILSSRSRTHHFPLWIIFPSWICLYRSVAFEKCQMKWAALLRASHTLKRVKQNLVCVENFNWTHWLVMESIPFFLSFAHTIQFPQTLSLNLFRLTQALRIGALFFRYIERPEKSNCEYFTACGTAKMRKHKKDVNKEATERKGTLKSNHNGNRRTSRGRKNGEYCLQWCFSNTVLHKCNTHDAATPMNVNISLGANRDRKNRGK